jgi:hypothetical protein
MAEECGRIHRSATKPQHQGVEQAHPTPEKVVAAVYLREKKGGQVEGEATQTYRYRQTMD